MDWDRSVLCQEVKNLFSVPGFEFWIVQPVILFTITIGLSGILGEIYAKLSKKKGFGDRPLGHWDVDGRTL